MPIAILDFGTNTFNLLIAEKKGVGFDILYSGKEGVKLGRGGIKDHIITREAMERAFNAIEKHLEVIQRFGAEDIHAFATAAVRSAENGKELVKSVKERYGISVNVIDGNREAELIYKGVRMAAPLDVEPAMILDIGGGSNEFIICNNEKVFWKHSFDLGMARILEQFELADPVSEANRHDLEAYFESELSELFTQTRKYQPATLIGASGTFDTFRSLIEHKNHLPINPLPGFYISMNDYASIHNELLHSTLEERKVMQGMEPVRVEMIVQATIFVNFVVRKCNIKKIYQSAYALKEGVMAELPEI